MSITAGWLRLFKTGSASQQVVLLLSAREISVAWKGEKEIITDMAVCSGVEAWAETVALLLSRNKLANTSVMAVFKHGLYQSLQIDHPHLPDDELSSALPFLLKDLISESPNEIVADGFTSPINGQRLQVYAISKKHLLTAAVGCEQAGAELASASVEELVWGAFTEGTDVLLQRYEGAALHLTAFKDKTPCFHRQIRGIESMLTGPESSSLQLDGLALELQRSLDFLSAQMRTSSVNQLIVACEGEDGHELSSALSERLSVSVSPAELAGTANQLLAWAAMQPAPVAVNLFPESLRPKQELLTLNRLLVANLIVTVMLVGLWGYEHIRATQQQAELDSVNRQLSSLVSQVDMVKKAVKERKPSQAKVDQVKALETQIESKKMVLSAVEEHDTGNPQGYAGFLDQLAQAASKDVSLSRINISGRRTNLSGQARDVDSVPGWVKRFTSFDELRQQRFSGLSLSRDDKNRLLFELSSEEQKKESSKE
ncbi:hypothetical protein NF212_01695 [Parasalinivibrio latis]|uniref:hypothetical protein n=1 Tax=Parasalinivibrio latis TaxID=2952610 RepID=UPI0030E361DA